MGYIRHNAIIVTCNYFEKEIIEKIYKKAVKIFGRLVSNIVESEFNGFVSFFIASDGSKEGWDEAEQADKNRMEFCNYLDTFAYKDLSSTIIFIDIGYDDEHNIKVDRKNKK